MLKMISSIILIITTTTSYAQTCNFNIQTTRPDSRYIIMSGGTEVKDTVTGLIWQRCSVGQQWNGSTCTGTAITHTWQQALSVAKNLGNGYRLPNIKELQSLVEIKCYDPAINISRFPNTQSNYYWSSSPFGYPYSNNAWYVDFSRGEHHDYFQSNSYYVRAVRSE